MERTLRIAADAMRASLVLGALWYVSFSTWHKHMGYAMAMMAVTAIVLRFAKAPAIFDFAFVTLLTFDAWATAAGAFENVNQNDRPGHLLLSAAVTPVLFYAAARAKAINDRPENAAQTAGVAIVALSLTLALGACWELVEWQADMHIGTDMSLGYSDTLGDLVCDLVGGLLGAAIVAATLTRARTRRAAAATARLAVAGDELAERPLALEAIHE